MEKDRFLTINGCTLEVIGVAGNYRGLINGSSHPVFVKFTSIKDVKVRFKQWIKNTSK